MLSLKPLARTHPSADIEKAFLQDLDIEPHETYSNADKWAIVLKELGPIYGEENLSLFEEYDYHKAYQTATDDVLAGYTFLADLQGGFYCVLLDEGIVSDQSEAALQLHEWYWCAFMKLSQKYAALATGSPVQHLWIH